VIPTNDNGVRVEGGLAAVESISMGIAPGQEEFVVNALSNLYSDKEMAVLREYAANALDATLEAAALGQPFRPIEVTLPSWDKPYLSIKDWGVGLTHDDIRRIYSQYGASTKRDSNDQTGLFGFGSKAGLTYTAAFTVTSVRDGIRIRATVEKTPGRS
jgi:DNA topoisomerase VI subunit B